MRNIYLSVYNEIYIILECDIFQKKKWHTLLRDDDATTSPIFYEFDFFFRALSECVHIWCCIWVGSLLLPPVRFLLLFFYKRFIKLTVNVSIQKWNITAGSFWLPFMWIHLIAHEGRLNKMGGKQIKTNFIFYNFTRPCSKISHYLQRHTHNTRKSFFSLLRPPAAAAIQI